MSGVRLRPARTDDVAALASIDAHSPGGGWSAAQFAEELRLAWSHVEVALCGEVVVGFMVYWLVEGEVQLLNIAIDPVRRRQGLGRALMTALVEGARARHAERVSLDVRRANAPALALYRAFGFREVGVRRGYYQSEGEDALLMELRLAEDRARE